ncbi:tRNA cytosine(34) acetyltransferase TmcA [Halobellus salinus]|uniref:tRNA(Met) cytidine acetyltransferase TmcA n=1 Tax=Halobellus salinus TaxID=931585 RepID=A0A830EAU3_9EURY|nr:tRNA(Met) cytidine acetyltransferase TmcA [Halobellus salinus]GGJ06395.1 tRNA cytosine(34) acetyltransferase TmcA [Halobellus salinus]SMP14627.1 tRNA(Met) cytidine acetyltransferase [Halobellus salinus]
MNVAGLAGALRTAAERADHRRVLVLAGDRDAGIDAAFDAVEGAGVSGDDVTVVTTREGFRFERVPPQRADRLLGTTREVVVCDAHEGFSPNVVGQLVGVVDGGGLFVLLTPPLEAWPDRVGSFDDSLAVPPFGVGDVGGRFRERLVDTLRTHPGVAVVDVDAGEIERRGEVERSPPVRASTTTPKAAVRRFPTAAYEACVTADQSRALHALESLDAADGTAPAAVVVEADRGRGKSSAAGLAAGSLAAAGRDVLVTAPARRSAAEVFDRAAAVLSELCQLDHRSEGAIATDAGGRIRFREPGAATRLPGGPDVVLVDEAAALSVRRLSSFLAADAVGFFTTVRGYEGSGRGFSVRFRDQLADADHDLTGISLSEPVRYAPGDPVESWAFRALLLDARPPVTPLVADPSPSSVTYEAPSAADLAADEHRLREVFGLLVMAHYRTEPDDLARVLDAPNLRVRTLEHGGHAVSVALLAREGGLDSDTRESMYEGDRVRGNMLPDVLTSQLRDEAAGAPVGCRVVRIATHHAARSRGLGSELLARIRGEFDGDTDYLGVGYGATPELVDFWAANGYRTVHLSTTRNDASGEYSALMIDPLSEAGECLARRHARWVRRRLPGQLPDQLRDADPDVVRGVLSACDAGDPPNLTDREWRVVVGVAAGPGQYATAPAPFRRLAVAALTRTPAGDGGNDSSSAGPPEDVLTPRAERLLVRKVLQGHPADEVAAELDYASERTCLRALGSAYDALVDRYGGDLGVVTRERDRFEGE